MKARWSGREGILGETFSGRLGGLHGELHGEVEGDKVGKFKANGCLVGLIR